jgi:hypothetical protein
MKRVGSEKAVSAGMEAWLKDADDEVDTSLVYSMLGFPRPGIGSVGQTWSQSGSSPRLSERVV